MRSSARPLGYCRPDNEATDRNTPTDIGALLAISGATVPVDLAAQIAAARHAARTRSLLAATLLRSWISEDD